MTEYLSELQFWDVFANVTFVLGVATALLIWRLASESDDCHKLHAKGFSIPLWAILIGAFVVRLPLMFQSPWYDETFSYAMTIPKWEDFPRVLMSDVHPPLHYLLIRFVAMFSDNIVMLRLPSLIAGLVLIIMVYAITLWSTNWHRGVSQIAALLTAFLPSLVYYSTEARYPIFLALAIAFAWLSILKSQNRNFLVSLIFMVGLHSTGLIYAGAFLVAFLIRFGKRGIKTFVAGGLISLWWLPFMLVQMRDVANGFWLPLESPVFHLVDMTSLRAGENLFLIFIVACLMIALLTLGFFVASNGFVFRFTIPFYLITIGVPVVLWSISVLWKPIYLPRALLGSIVLILPFSASAILMFRPRQLFFALIAFAMGYSIVGLVQNGRGWRVDSLMDNCQNADVIFVPETYLAIMARYYSDKPIVAWTESNNPHQELEPGALEAMGIARAPNLDNLSGTICIPYRVDYFTSDNERDFIESLSAYHPQQFALSPQHHLFRYYVLILENHEREENDLLLR